MLDKQTIRCREIARLFRDLEDRGVTWPREIIEDAEENDLPLAMYFEDSLPRFDSLVEEHSGRVVPDVWATIREFLPDYRLVHKLAIRHRLIEHAVNYDQSAYSLRHFKACLTLLPRHHFAFFVAGRYQGRFRAPVLFYVLRNNRTNFVKCLIEEYADVAFPAVDDTKGWEYVLRLVIKHCNRGANDLIDMLLEHALNTLGVDTVIVRNALLYLARTQYKTDDPRKPVWCFSIVLKYYVCQIDDPFLEEIWQLATARLHSASNSNLQAVGRLLTYLLLSDNVASQKGAVVELKKEHIQRGFARALPYNNTQHRLGHPVWLCRGVVALACAPCGLEVMQSTLPQAVQCMHCVLSGALANVQNMVKVRTQAQHIKQRITEYYSTYDPLACSSTLAYRDATST